MDWTITVKGLLILAFFAPLAAALMNLFLFVEQAHPARGLSPMERRAVGRRYGRRVLVRGLAMGVAIVLIQLAARWFAAGP
jgi:hypothetical protein